MSAVADKQVDDREGAIVTASEIAFKLGEKIPYVKAGSSDTLLSASRANQIIAAYNRFAGMTVGPGLRITWADSGPVISIDENT